MIFARLTLTNFGVYAGRHDFELRPQLLNGDVRPVVLYGGKNGAGKTTILEAIRLCLYGRGALGSRVRKTQYETFIRQRLHRGSKQLPAASFGSVGLLIEHTHAGVSSTYDAVRSWRLDGDGIKEDVSIYKDGKPFQEIAAEHWNDFLRDLIPSGVADLFFFDGEQIQALADDDYGTESLATAIRGLLNLDLIDRLRTDLSVYLRQQAQQEHSTLQQTYVQVQDKHSQLNERYLERYQDLSQLRGRDDYLQKELDQARQTLIREGVSFIHLRTTLEARQEELAKEINQVHAAIHELAAGLLPFAVSPQWLNRLHTRLTDESQAERANVLHEAQLAQAAQVALTVLDHSFQQRTAENVLPQDWASIASAVQSLLAPTNQAPTAEQLHPIGQHERNTLGSWITVAIDHVPQQLHLLTEQLERLEAERSEVERSLKQIPTEGIAQPLIVKFNDLANQKGRLELQMAQLSEEVQQLKRACDDVQRQLVKLDEEIAQSTEVGQRVQRAAQVQVVLNQYQAQITAVKLGELEQSLAQYFNLLCRKRMLVREVKIDPRDFTVQLYGTNRALLHKSELSAGEKQLYALALLWALRAVSGRALPIIVDTPMGRLDSDHRTALLTHFFPHAAHQVILLSTDTEIDPSAYTLLEPAVSHTFRLEFDQDQGCTQVQRGYFLLQDDGVPA